jgi:predicted nucleic acid-binding protein
MGKINLQTNKKIMLDTAPLIYYIENINPYFALLQGLFESIAIGDNPAVTSIVTLIEVLTKPIRDKQYELAEKYRLYLTQSKNLELIAVTTEIGEQSAYLRAKYNLRTADAIQVAVAIVSGSHLFITNDMIFKRVKEINVVILDDLLRNMKASI